MTKTLRLTATALLIAAAGLMTACSTTEEALVAPGASTSTTNSALEALKLKLGADKVDEAMAANAKLPVTQATITYKAEICEDGSFTGTAVRNSYSNSAYWTYYKFYGTAGDAVTISVNRTSCVMDAAFQLMYGTSTSTTGIAYGNVTSADLTLIATSDDVNVPPNFPDINDCDCGKDPEATFTLSQTGYYTIGLFDAGYCSYVGGARNYELVISGTSPCVTDTDADDDGIDDAVDNCPSISNADQLNTDGDANGNACDTDDDNDGVADASDNCPLVSNASQTDTDNDGIGNTCDTDDDGDGVADASDNCPLLSNADQANFDGDSYGDACDSDDDNDGISDDQDANDNSDTAPTVAIDGCSSGVDNDVVSNGNTMMDLINSCLASAGNHGQFVSCVNQLANDWKAAGLITNQQKNAIGNCASSSNLP